MAQGTVVVMDICYIVGMRVVAVTMAINTGGSRTGHPARCKVVGVVRRDQQPASTSSFLAYRFDRSRSRRERASPI